MPEYPISELVKLKYDSPSGYVNIGKYIPPFEEIKDGYGYLGVIVEDYESGKLQCSICGKWLEIFNSHLKSVHNISCSDYKKKFGLSQSTALRSKRLRLIQSKVMQENRKKYVYMTRKFNKNNLESANRKDKPKSVEHINKHGICKLQVADKIIKLSEKLNKTPTLTELKEEYGYGFITTLHDRYGSYISFCKSIGMNPNFSNYNPKYSREYFIEKFLDKEPSHRLMTISESRNMYKYFKNGIEELKNEVDKVKLNRLKSELPHPKS